MKFSLREEKRNRYERFYTEFLEVVNRLNQQVYENLQDEVNKIKYEKAQKKLSAMLQTYLEMADVFHTKIFLTWKDSKASLRALMRLYKAGDATDALCNRTEEHLEDALREILKIEKKDQVSFAEPEVSDEGLDRLEEICKKARTEIQEIKRDFLSRLTERESENDIYGTLRPLLEGIAGHMETFFDESYRGFVELHEFFREANEKQRKSNEEAVAQAARTEGGTDISGIDENAMSSNAGGGNMSAGASNSGGTATETKEESEHSDGDPKEAEVDQKDPEEKPEGTEEKPEDKEEKPESTEEKSEDKEEKPEDKEEKPEDKEEKPESKEEKPEDKEEKSEDKEEKTEGKEEKPEDKEDKPEDKEDKEEKPEGKEDKEEKPEDKEDKEEKPEDKEDKEEKPEDKEDKPEDSDGKSEKPKEKNSKLKCFEDKVVKYGPAAMRTIAAGLPEFTAGTPLERVGNGIAKMLETLANEIDKAKKEEGKKEEGKKEEKKEEGKKEEGGLSEKDKERIDAAIQLATAMLNAMGIPVGEQDEDDTASYVNDHSGDMTNGLLGWLFGDDPDMVRLFKILGFDIGEIKDEVPNEYKPAGNGQTIINNVTPINNTYMFQGTQSMTGAPDPGPVNTMHPSNGNVPYGYNNGAAGNGAPYNGAYTSNGSGQYVVNPEGRGDTHMPDAADRRRWMGAMSDMTSMVGKTDPILANAMRAAAPGILRGIESGDPKMQQFGEKLMHMASHGNNAGAVPAQIADMIMGNDDYRKYAGVDGDIARKSPLCSEYRKKQGIQEQDYPERPECYAVKDPSKKGAAKADSVRMQADKGRLGRAGAFNGDDYDAVQLQEEIKELEKQDAKNKLNGYVKLPKDSQMAKMAGKICKQAQDNGLPGMFREKDGRYNANEMGILRDEIGREMQRGDGRDLGRAMRNSMRRDCGYPREDMGRGPVVEDIRELIPLLDDGETEFSAGNGIDKILKDAYAFNSRDDAEEEKQRILNDASAGDGLFGLFDIFFSMLTIVPMIIWPLFDPFCDADTSGDAEGNEGRAYGYLAGQIGKDRTEKLLQDYELNNGKCKRR